jgi:hypothetical protein
MKWDFSELAMLSAGFAAVNFIFTHHREIIAG